LRSKFNLGVEIWDKGDEGIAMDNTAAFHTVDTREIGCLGSLYFLKAAQADIKLPRMFIRIPRQGNGYNLPLEEILAARQSFENSAGLLSRVDTHIPMYQEELVSL